MSIGLVLSALEEAGYLCSFEREVAILEDACKFELRGDGTGGPMLVGVERPEDQEVVERYAAEILAAIGRVRAHLAAGEGSKAAAEAMMVGELATEVDEMFGSPAAKAWRASQEQRRQATNASVKQRSSRKDRRQEAVRELLQRSKRRPSAAEIARRLAADQDLDDDVRYGDVKAQEMWSLSTLGADRIAAEKGPK